jgi:hypothetical protein
MLWFDGWSECRSLQDRGQSHAPSRTRFWLLDCAEVWLLFNAAEEEIVFRVGLRLLDPGADGVARRWRDLELNGTFFLLRHGGSARDFIAVEDIA